MTSIKAIVLMLWILLALTFNGCGETLYFIDNGNGGSYICTQTELEKYNIDRTKIQYITSWDKSKHGNREWKTHEFETSCNDEDYKKYLESLAK